MRMLLLLLASWCLSLPLLVAQRTLYHPLALQRIWLPSLASWRMSLPPGIVENIAPSSGSAEGFAPPAGFVVAVALHSCSALDVMPPLGFALEIAPPHCLVRGVVTLPKTLISWGTSRLEVLNLFHTSGAVNERGFFCHDYA